MTEELRAAAERRRANPGWKGMAYPYPTAVDDAVLLADAYLAEHPADDGEPITLEWFQSVGGVYSKWDSGYQIIISVHLCLHLRGGEAFIQGQFKRCKTRGDVRRLCAALGITLKEKEQS